MNVSADAAATIGKIAVTAILYIICGKLGLYLALPPGYATVIWPASGIAVGALLAHGRLLWPGILLGSFALNATVSLADVSDPGRILAMLSLAVTIAIGSTLQALVASWLIERFVGRPIDLRGVGDLLKLFALAAPFSCMIAASVGTLALFLCGLVKPDALAWQWSTWWLGDVLGILLFTPLVLIAPGAREKLYWRGAPFGALPVAAILVLLLPIGLTFYAWKASSEHIYERGRTTFAASAAHDEQALLHRLASYNQGLLGAAGFFKGSESVSAAEWKTYVDAIAVVRNFPGIIGIGFIRNVATDDRVNFVAEQRRERPDFSIHPEASGRPSYVVEFFEPLAVNRPAIGLNIAFEEHRLLAATLSRDSGTAAITKRVTLLGDFARGNGFLMLQPVYRAGSPTSTVVERQTALFGWVYAPFNVDSFMHALSGTQDETLGLRIYDGARAEPSNLIFASGAAVSARPEFRLQKTVNVLQQSWTLVWTSTPAFERGVGSGEPALILAGGIFSTILFGILLFMFAHRAETVRVIVEKQTRELAERERLYRLLAENTTDMISRVSLDGTRIYTSPASKRLLGYDPEELAQTNAKWDVHPDQLAQIEEHYTRLARGEIDDATGVFALRRRDGGWIQAEIGWQLIRDPRTGTPLELVVTNRDVTQREQRAAELNLAKEEAETAKAKAEGASEAKSAFLATMSHEIRTPLNGVVGYADLLLHAPGLSPDNRRHAERINASAASLLTVVNDILDFSKIEAGQIDLASEAFSLEELIENTLSIVRGSAERKGLVLRVNRHTVTDIHLIGDEGRLRQVLLNLLNNAIKFTREGEVVLRVETVRVADDRERLFFSVSDTGIGIPALKQPLLFECFTQVDGSIQREFGGTGLGLAICKQLVVLMGGSIAFDSQEGKGSTFRFEISLPLARDVERPSSKCSTVPARAGRHLLLAEDVVLNQELACAILRNAGYSVDVVGNGADAVRAVQKRHYDLVLMDVQMPGMDGITATRTIRRLDHPSAGVPIIALTANVLPIQVSEYHEAGVSDHIGKPFKRDALIAAIERNAAGTNAPAPLHQSPPDNARLDELTQLFGRKSVHGLLDTLVVELGTRFTQIDGEKLDTERLAHDAHALLSAGGALGFTRLAELCRSIEEACRAGADCEVLIADLKVLSRQTIAEIRAIQAA